MSEENKLISNSAGTPNPLRRRRRGSRGGRGRSRRTAPSPAPSGGTPPPDDEVVKPVEGPDFDAEPETEMSQPVEAQEHDSEAASVVEVEAAPPAEERPQRAPVRPPVQRSQDYRPQREPRPQRPPAPPPAPEPQRQGSAVAQAVEDVYGIVETLKKVMEDLDELLETLELAERQKIEDERELDNLRRAMRQLQPRPSAVQSRVPQREPSRHQPHHHDRPARPSQAPPARNEEVREQSRGEADEPPQT